MRKMNGWLRFLIARYDESNLIAQLGALPENGHKYPLLCAMPLTVQNTGQPDGLLIAGSGYPENP